MKRFLLFSFPLFFLFFTACQPASPTSSGSKPTINSFTASPPSLPAGGGSTTLSWAVEGAATLEIDGGVGAVTGTSKTVSVTSNTTFTLTASNESGSATQNASVSVATGADTTPPTVTSVDPPDGAKGIKMDQVITITFSEKMDKATTEVAFQPRELTVDDVTFIWNAGGSTLTIQPKRPLVYEQGPSNPAQTYTVSFSGVAKDVAGNSLAPFSSTFSTLRKFYTVFGSTPSLDGAAFDSGVADADSSLEVFVGYSPLFKTGRGFFSFDITSLPEGTTISEANLAIYKNEVVGFPYFELGIVSLAHVNYGGSFDGTAYSTPVLADLGGFDSLKSPNTGYLTSNVTSALADDLARRAERGNRSQYRLAFAKETPKNDGTLFVRFLGSDTIICKTCAPGLRVSYLAP